jgi:hypothetical protein
MYPPPELVAQAGPFGGADLVQQRGTVAELAQICQTWGATLAAFHSTATHGPSAPLAARPWVINPEHRPASMGATSMRTGPTGLGYAAGAALGRHAAAADGLSDLGIPARRRTGSALSGYASRTGAGYRCMGRRFSI